MAYSIQKITETRNECHKWLFLFILPSKFSANLCTCAIVSYLCDVIVVVGFNLLFFSVLQALTVGLGVVDVYIRWQ